MKTTSKRLTGHIYVEFWVDSAESELMPKHLQVFNLNNELIAETWLTMAATGLKQRFKTGTYLVQLTLTSGQSQSKVTEVRPGERSNVRFDLTALSPHEDMEWAYFANANLSKYPQKDQTLERFPFYLSYRFLSLQNGHWTKDYDLQVDKRSPLEIRDLKGTVFQTITLSRATVIEISYENYPKKTISLPPDSPVMILIRPVLNPAQRQISPLEVVVTTNNWKAEALLSLLKTGAITEARSLMTLKQAEQLLLQKRQDPAAATIGGYYLLRANALARLHNWPKNLADWFPYLPDGAIIYATQLINSKRPKKEKIKESRDYFVKAFSRGTPIYTEGFRLLLNGITQHFEHSDRQDTTLGLIINDLQQKKRQLDWSQNVTVFNGINPDISPDGEEHQTNFAPAEGDYRDITQPLALSY